MVIMSLIDQETSSMSSIQTHQIGCKEKHVQSRNLVQLTLDSPNTTIAEFASTEDPDEIAHNEPSHLDL